MLTRGYFIGEIVDDLANLGGQVRMRNALHYFDLTVSVENFFRDFLNIALGADFKNLNAKRSNEPGLDLGDVAKRIGVQVTSSATTAKVNNTLRKVTPEQGNAYTRIIVLGLNKRQQSYSIEQALADQYKFSIDDIWDLDTLARKALDLEIDRLQSLYNFVRANSARLKMELEVPDENDEYPTSGYELWEKRATPKLGDGAAFARFVKQDTGDTLDVKSLEKALQELGSDLSRLPRMTREFLAILYERRELGKSRRFSSDSGWEHLLLAKAQREYQGDDFEGELEILTHAGFVEVNGEDRYELGAPEIGIRIPTTSTELRMCFVSFVNEEKLGFRSVIGSVDLSAF
jgi:hypothetical protein